MRAFDVILAQTQFADYKESSLRKGLYGFVDLGKRPFQVRINKNAVDTRKRIALIHEILHIGARLYKIELSHEDLHVLAVFIDQELLPVVAKADAIWAGSSPGQSWAQGESLNLPNVS